MCLSVSTTESAAEPSGPPKTQFYTLYTIMLGVLMLVIMLTACAPRTLVVLVPDKDGTVGAVQVNNPAGGTTIDSACHYTRLKDLQHPPSPPANMEKSQIEKHFGPVLAIEPPPPSHFLLYFATGSDKLQPESVSGFSAAVECINATNSRYVSVVGHTDTVGDAETNYALSLQRAEAVKQMLVQAGVDESALSVSSHGKFNPIVPTADNVANAANRRVEIVVR